MKLPWFGAKYECVNGHRFSKLLELNGTKLCPKCAALSMTRIS